MLYYSLFFRPQYTYFFVIHPMHEWTKNLPREIKFLLTHKEWSHRSETTSLAYLVLWIYFKFVDREIYFVTWQSHALSFSKSICTSSWRLLFSLTKALRSRSNSKVTGKYQDTSFFNWYHFCQLNFYHKKWTIRKGIKSQYIFLPNTSVNTAFMQQKLYVSFIGTILHKIM